VVFFARTKEKRRQLEKEILRDSLRFFAGSLPSFWWIICDSFYVFKINFEPVVWFWWFSLQECAAK